MITKLSRNSKLAPHAQLRARRPMPPLHTHQLSTPSLTTTPIMTQSKSQNTSSTSPDALTSSTRTDFTYPQLKILTKTLLKYAKNANLRKLAYPTDLHTPPPF
ncbi:hypothetical protein MHU86_4467 [Fragilaria crotonensis]|nr:hypothetical protein MHU86_4467 [Fragilaria crotonensis]